MLCRPSHFPAVVAAAVVVVVVVVVVDAVVGLVFSQESSSQSRV